MQAAAVVEVKFSVAKVSVAFSNVYLIRSYLVPLPRGAAMCLASDKPTYSARNPASCVRKLDGETLSLT